MIAPRRSPAALQSFRYPISVISFQAANFLFRLIALSFVRLLPLSIHHPLPNMAGLINGLVGLAAESISHHHHKKKVAAQAKAAEHSHTPISSEQSRDISELGHDDESDWALDDAQHEVVGEPTSKEFETDEALVAHFLQDQPPPEYTETHHASQRIPFPVVLPQRRPNNHSDGFIRAYAPVLVNRGIDHAMFLHFLEYFDKSTKVSPYLNAINLAGTTFGFLAPGTSTAIEVATAMAVEAGIETQSREKYVYVSNFHRSSIPTNFSAGLAPFSTESTTNSSGPEDFSVLF
jgi:hypothetical protein